MEQSRVTVHGWFLANRFSFGWSFVWFDANGATDRTLTASFVLLVFFVVVVIVYARRLQDDSLQQKKDRRQDSRALSSFLFAFFSRVRVCGPHIEQRIPNWVVEIVFNIRKVSLMCLHPNQKTKEIIKQWQIAPDSQFTPLVANKRNILTKQFFKLLNCVCGGIWWFDLSKTRERLAWKSVGGCAIYFLLCLSTGCRSTHICRNHTFKHRKALCFLPLLLHIRVNKQATNNSLPFGTNVNLSTQVCRSLNAILNLQPLATSRRKVERTRSFKLLLMFQPPLPVPGSIHMPHAS